VGCDIGFTTVQWRIRAADQPLEYRGYFSDWSDDYGVPSETAQVVGPAISTRALVTGPGGDVQDVLTVAGPVPAAGMDATWAGYLRPVGSDVAVCTPATLKFSSAAPTVVTAAGEFPSEKFRVPDDFIGSIDWVETLTLHGAGTILHEGVCGATGETSISALPTITTTPPAGLLAGQGAFDTVTVDGWVPENASVVVRLYKQAKGATSLVCDASTQVGGDLGPVSIAPGIAGASAYRSPTSAALKAGSYGFVAQLLDQKGTVLAEGGCQDELFSLTTLPFTGVAPSTSGWLSGAGWLLLAGLALVLYGRRQKRSPWSFPITE
jgi:hypothetical protein